MKKTQIERVAEILKRDGKVSRNALLDQPFEKITRLSDIILKLRAKGYEITTEETDRDTIYRAKVKSVKSYYVVYPDGKRELVSKNVYV